MLKSIDILIGLALIMLMISMAVTLVTQTLINIVQSRGRHLRRGISDLLAQLAPDLPQKTADSIATAVLMHPVIRGGRFRMGDVIKREELAKLLMEFGSGAPLPNGTELAQDARDKLRALLENHGIASPEATLRNVRTLALELERSNPALSTTVRHNLALLHEAKSDYLAKINTWFDQTMDRVSERFTYSARIATLISAAIVAGIIQLDTVQIVNRLAADDATRNALVEMARKAQDDPKLNTAGTPDAQTLRTYNQLLSGTGMIHVPSSYTEWSNRWSAVNVPGLLISILLLSLGAPFWYGLLNKLLQLRSMLAQKDDNERNDRQTTHDVVSTPVGPAPAQRGILRGESGDLAAVG